MTGKLWLLVLYPALADGLTPTERQIVERLAQGMEETERSKLIGVLSKQMSKEDMQQLAATVPKEAACDYFLLAREIASAGGLSEAERIAVEDLRNALGIDSESSPLEPSDARRNERPEEESFEVIAINYSKMAAAIAALPLPVVSGILIILPLQTDMIGSISRLYRTEVDARKLLKSVIGSIGVGYAIANVGEGILGIIPVAGWLAAGAITFATTYAIALVAKRHMEGKEPLDEEEVREVYISAYEEGKKQFEILREAIAESKDSLVQQLMVYI